MPYNHISLDIETTGTDPSHAAIVQIAAVAMDLETRQIAPAMFNESLLIPKNRFWDEDTRDWWASQDQAILQRIWARMREPHQVLLELNAWVREQCEGEPAVLWAKPISFEHPFLASYYRQFDLPNPFHFRLCEDLNSWCRARGRPNLSREIPVEGPAHDAIFDALHQAQVLLTLLETTA